METLEDSTSLAVREAFANLRDPILRSWTEDTLSSAAVRADPRARDRLFDQCATFLERLLAIYGSSSATDWSELDGPLVEIVHVQTELGLSPKETTQFVFSLKAAMLQAVRQTLLTWSTSEVLRELGRLDHMLAHVTSHALDVHAKSREELILKQADAILELSCPIIKLWDGILLCVIIGTVDSARAQDLLESTLNGVARLEAQIAIIDITGVSSIDTRVLQHLFTIVKGIKFMGAEVILTGVNTAVAATVTKLHIDLTTFTSQGTLRQGLREAFRRLHVRV